MPSGLQQKSLTILGGDIMVKPLDQPEGGYIPLGAVSEFTLTPKVQHFEEKSRMVDDYGNVYAAMDVPDGVDVAMTITQFSRLAWALALGAESTDLAQAAEENLSEVVTLPHGRWVDLSKVLISNVSITVGSVEAVEGTEHAPGVDFLVKPEAGMIMACTKSTLITDGATVTVYYDCAATAEDAYTLAGAVRGNYEVGLFVDGINKHTRRRHLVEIPKLTISGGEAVSYLTAEPSKVPVKGTILVEPGKDPFTQTML